MGRRRRIKDLAEIVEEEKVELPEKEETAKDQNDDLVQMTRIVELESKLARQDVELNALRKGTQRIEDVRAALKAHLEQWRAEIMAMDVNKGRRRTWELFMALLDSVSDKELLEGNLVVNIWHDFKTPEEQAKVNAARLAHIEQWNEKQRQKAIKNNESSAVITEIFKKIVDHIDEKK